MMNAALALAWRFRWALAALAIAGLIVWQRATIKHQRAEIAAVSQRLEAEEKARKADVAGLTTLARGMAAAKTASAKDQEILSHAIDTQKPVPASPGLARFLECLRQADLGRECAAAGTSPAAPAGPASPAAAGH